MTKEKAREFAALLLAYAEGKTIEWRFAGNPTATWQDNEHSDFSGLENGTIEYRIKSEPKLRPWTAEEVPVGRVVRLKGPGTIRRVIIAADQAVVTLGSIHSCDPIARSTLFCDYVMDDGSPCGIQEQPC